MIEQTFIDIYDEELADGAIINDRCGGHKEDYLVLHCLLRKYKPKLFCELGTNTGFGTKIIKNALGDKSDVFTIDLPAHKSGISNQHPIMEGKGDCVGHECDLEYFQIFEDSRTFDYTKFDFDGFFVDTDHTYQNVFSETKSILKTIPKIIIYHDADVDGVYNAIVDAMYNEPYNAYHVIDTRIAYCLRKQTL